MVGAVEKGWRNPWRELRRREHLLFSLEPLVDVDGVLVPRGPRGFVFLAQRLPRRERAAALAHELVHDQRGGGCPERDMPADWAAVVRRDEARVNRIAAEHLLPREELEDFIAVRLILGEPVEPYDVAEHFDVAEWVALTALEGLSRARRAS